MKFGLYLTEDDNQKTLDEFKKNTSQWFKEMGDVKLWRGTKHRIKDIKKLTSRVDRRPLDTPKEVHDWFDDAFKKEFGWKPRSSGVFTCPSKFHVEVFGKPYLIYPINGYKYIWSKHISDLTNYLENIRILVQPTERNHQLGENWYDKKILKEYTEATMSLYTDKNLKNSRGTSVEVTLYCPNGYYLMDKQYYSEYIENKVDGHKL